MYEPSGQVCMRRPILAAKCWGDNSFMANAFSALVVFKGTSYEPIRACLDESSRVCSACIWQRCMIGRLATCIHTGRSEIRIRGAVRRVCNKDYDTLGSIIANTRMSEGTDRSGTWCLKLNTLSNFLLVRGVDA